MLFPHNVRAEIGFLHAGPENVPSWRSSELRSGTTELIMAQASSRAAGAKQPAAPIFVTAAERLTIKFPGRPDLTGEYRVNADQTVSVPAVGRIPVSGMTPEMLEKLLTQRMAELVPGQEEYVTVEVAEYGPIFVTGHVDRPGPFPWRPGFTVDHAVALAGGFYRIPGAVDSGLSEWRKAADDRKRALANLARLRSERRGENTVTASPELIQLVGKADAEELMRVQAAVLVGRRSALDAQLKTIERGRLVAEQELEALREQTMKLTEQLRQRRNYKQRLEELQKKGYGLAERTMEEDLRVGELEEKITNISVAVARVQATMSTLQREALAAKQDRELNVDTEIAQNEREAAQSLIVMEGAEARAAPTKNGAASIVYAIRRNEVGELRAEPGFPLYPGDVVIVSLTGK